MKLILFHSTQREMRMMKMFMGALMIGFIFLAAGCSTKSVDVDATADTEVEVQVVSDAAVLAEEVTATDDLGDVTTD
jgi:starvation-inducible outer membrane lipoprotein